MMPRMNGPDCFRELKKINKNIRVVVASGYSVKSEAQGMLDEGAVAFIQKPFKIDTLSKVLEKAIV